MSKDDKIVAVGLLTQSDFMSWGHKLRHVYRAENTPDFDDLLRAIDKAESERHNHPLKC